MDNAIFSLNMSTEATSLYILITSLVAEGQPVTLDACELRWTTTCEQMAEALGELVARGVVKTENDHLYVQDQGQWKQAD